MKISIRTLKIASVAIATIGIIVAYLLARTTSAPLMSIIELRGNYAINYATIRIRGVVSDYPYIDNSTGRLYISFEVNDGTDTISVRVYSPTSIKLVSLGLLPFLGDEVEIEGQVRVKEDYVYMVLQDVRGLKILGTPQFEGNVSSLSIWDNYKYLGAEGYVSGLRTVSSGYLFDIKTSGGSITVLVPYGLMYVEPELYFNFTKNIADGRRVYIRGIVYLYRGTQPEFVVKTLKDVFFLKEKGAVTELLKLGDFISNIGKYKDNIVGVEARLNRIFYHSDTRSYTVEFTDPSNLNIKFNMSVSSSSILYKSLNGLYSLTGTLLNLSVYVSGSLTVDVRKISVIEYPVNSMEELKQAKVDIGDIGEDDRGVIYAVVGTVTSDPSIVGSSLKFKLKDNTGAIDVFIPGGKYMKNWESLIRSGAKLVVVGYVDIYRGALEIVVYDFDGVAEDP